MKRIYFLMLTVLLPIMVSAVIPPNYYNNANGKKKADLKSALRGIIFNANVLDYGQGAGKTWSGFYSTDRYNGNQVRDRYSNEKFYFPASASAQSASAVSGMNIEHSFPKSWWGGANNQAYKDLFNLNPSESKINSSKSNYAMGVVTTAKVDNGCTKVGNGTAGTKSASLWEPADQWKGDFARSYFYMVTTYSNLTWTGEGLTMLENNEYPTLQKWAYELLLQWSKQDPVDEIEKDRNEAVYAIQGNRNPFVDFPNLCEYIWGDSVNFAFNVDGTVVNPGTGGDDPGVDPDDPDVPAEDLMALLDNDFTVDAEGWTIKNVTLPAGSDYVWFQDSKYGMKATSFVSKTKNDAEAWLISPEIDLTNMQSASIDFSHAGRYFGNVEKETTLWISCNDGVSWTQLPINTNILNDNTWTYVDNTTDLTAYCGEKVKIGFKYVGTTDFSGTWEIKTVKVTGIKKAENPDDKVDDFMAYSANEIVSSVYSTRFDANWGRYGEGSTYTLDVYTKDMDGNRTSFTGFPVTTKEHSYRVTGIKPGTTYYYQVFVYDESGKLKAQSNEVQVDFPEVDPVFSVSPTEMSFATVPGTPSAAQEIQVSLVATQEKVVNIVVDEPFEIAEILCDEDPMWQQELTVNDASFTFLVRLSSVDNEGEYTGHVTLKTKGVEDKQVFLMGSVDSQKAYFEDFEKGTKGSYAESTVACNASTWHMYNALLAKDANTNGSTSVRIKGAGYIEMTSDKEGGCDSLWFYSGLYNKDTDMMLKVEYSQDEAQSWTPVVEGLPVSTWQRFGYKIGVDGTIRLRFTAVGKETKRVVLDEVQMSDYVLPVTPGGDDEDGDDDDDTDGIAAVEKSIHISSMYDLSGRRVKQPTPNGSVRKGIYLMNGKKIVR